MVVLTRAHTPSGMYGMFLPYMPQVSMSGSTRRTESDEKTTSPAHVHTHMRVSQLYLRQPEHSAAESALTQVQ